MRLDGSGSISPLMVDDLLVEYVECIIRPFEVKTILIAVRCEVSLPDHLSSGA